MRSQIRFAMHPADERDFQQLLVSDESFCFIAGPPLGDNLMAGFSRRQFFCASSGAASGSLLVPGLAGAAEGEHLDYSHRDHTTGKPKPLKTSEFPDLLSMGQPFTLSDGVPPKNLQPCLIGSSGRQGDANAGKKGNAIPWGRSFTI